MSPSPRCMIYTWWISCERTNSADKSQGALMVCGCSMATQWYISWILICLVFWFCCTLRRSSASVLAAQRIRDRDAAVQGFALLKALFPSVLGANQSRQEVLPEQRQATMPATRYGLIMAKNKTWMHFKTMLQANYLLNLAQNFFKFYIMKRGSMT